MTSYDFLMYCLGASVLLVSGAWAIRLLRRPRPAAPTAEDVRRPMGLQGRLENFQEQRYAPLRPPTPGEPGGPRVVPPVRVLQPRTKPFSVPRQPPPLKKPSKGDVVVPLPVRLPKDDDTKKE